MSSTAPVGTWLFALLLLAVAFGGWRWWQRRHRQPATRARPHKRVNVAASAPAQAPQSSHFASTLVEPDPVDATSLGTGQPSAFAEDTVLESRFAEPPRRIGPYLIERDIGRGAMGMVLQGRHVQTQQSVALKTMALGREFAGSDLAEARDRFFREAEMASRLQHPDIVAIREAGEEGGTAYIAMELLSGRDLSQHAMPGRLLPLADVVSIGARVALALAHAHRQGVTHRDIKPSNIMIDAATGMVKVTDFGIARIIDSTQTRTGLVLGTPSFMSPEQMAGARVDGRSDLYALGVTLFQLLTGSLPHRGDSMAALIRAIGNDPAPDVRTLRPELPQALADVIALTLEKRPEVRYSDGQQLATDLYAVLASMRADAGQVVPAPTATPGSAAPATVLPGKPPIEARHNP